MGGPDMTPLRRKKPKKGNKKNKRKQKKTGSKPGVTEEPKSLPDLTPKPAVPEQKETGSEPELTEKPKSLLDMTPEQLEIAKFYATKGYHIRQKSRTGFDF